MSDTPAAMLARVMRPRNKHNARGFRDPSGAWWASGAEYRYWLGLKDRERHGEITDLERQPGFEVVPSFTDWMGRHHAPRMYHADFRYVDRHGHTYVDDVKGHYTEAFGLRWVMVLYLYTEVRVRGIDAHTLAPVATR